MKWFGFIILGVGLFVRFLRHLFPAPVQRKPLKKSLDAGTVSIPPAIATDEIGLDSLLNKLTHQRQPLERFTIYTELLKEAYRGRKKPASRQLLMEQGKYLFAELENMLPALRAEMGPEPEVLPIKWIAIALEEDGRYEDAMSICHQALGWKLQDGTKTGFAGRIARLDRKRQKEQQEQPA
jgi:hypothetical protein